MASDARVRAVEDSDRAALASLLLDAYRGTIDDEGEGQAEALHAVNRYLSCIIRPYSVAVQDAGSVVAISFVVLVHGRNFIDPVATAASHKRQGLGRLAVANSLALLASDGIRDVGAVITDGNEASEALFASLGFVRIGAWPRPSQLPDVAEPPPLDLPSDNR